MTEKHFVLDVDPDGLRAVATQVADLARTFRRRGRQAGAAPDEVGNRWTGLAADVVKDEMRVLGDHLDDFAGRLDDLPAALRGLAADYQEALDRLPGMNRRWEEAEQAYQDAVAAADSALSRGRADARGEDGALDPSDAASLRRTRDGAVDDAAAARHQTQYWLEYEFHHTKVHLAQRTRELGELLRGSGPLRVDDATVAAWRAGQGPRIDTTPLLSTLPLSELRALALVTPEVERQVAALRAAMEDGDPEALEAALEAIAAWADDPVMTQALVQVLGADGVQDVHLHLDEAVKQGHLDLESAWQQLRGFNDAVARGTSQLSDEDFAEHLQQWMEQDYGPMMWALLASSDQADGRINAVALSYHSEVYNGTLDGLGGGLFPTVLGFAYPDTDQVEQWAERSSGADLARVLETMVTEEDEEFLDDLLFRMLNVQVPGGTMRHEDFAHVARLWAEVVEAMHTRSARAFDEGSYYDHSALMRVLASRYANAGQVGYDLPRGVVDDLLDDPRVLIGLMGDSEDGKFLSSELARLLEQEDVDTDALVREAVALRLGRDVDAEQAAVEIGHLLALRRVMKIDLDWAGLLEDAATALAARHPAGAAAGTVKDALLGLGEEVAAAEDAINEATSKNARHETIAFMLYASQHGFPDSWYRFLAQTEDLPADPVTRVQEYVNWAPGNAPEREWERLSTILNRLDSAEEEG